MKHLALALLALALSFGQAFAQSVQEWPSRPVRFIVPFPGGSATDTIARIVAQKLTASVGQQIVVDNRAGASGAIGSAAVAQADPDGYTMGLITNSTHAVAVSLNPNLPYDPIRDFAHVSMIGSSPYVLAIHPGVPARTVTELVALAKARPGALNYASAGEASLAHLAGALFANLTGVELTHIPYRSSGQSVLDLVAGRIEMQFGTLPPFLPNIRDGKLIALAVTGNRRVAAIPEIPTIAEAGVPNYEASLWMAIVMPAATSPAIVDRLNRTLGTILASPDTVEALVAQGLDPEPGTPDALRERILVDTQRWREVIVKAGIKG